MTTSSGTFALKINDSVGLKNRFTSIYNNPNNAEAAVHFSLLDASFTAHVKIGDTAGQQKLQFLQFLKQNNVPQLDLYEQDSNGQWKKLSLDPTGTQLIETNC